MKTLLKIEVDSQGISRSECDIDQEIDAKRLVASLLGLMTESERFEAAINTAAYIYQENKGDMKKTMGLSRMSAMAKLTNKHKS